MKLRPLLLSAALTMAALPAAAEHVISVNTKKVGAEIQPTQYGIFFEDINFAADGGLYAELIKNRSFEFTPDHLMGWEAFGKVVIKDDGPFERNPHYARLTGAGHRDMWTGLQNGGFFGIGLHKDADYRLSVWARVPDGRPVNLWIQFVDQFTNAEGQDFVNADLQIDSREWKKYTIVLKSPRTIDKASLRIFLTGDRRHSSIDGCVDLEHISLFPVDTWKGHENGMRKDLAQHLANMKPGVFRFPGGCIVEGTTIEQRYQWKNTVGPVENRPLNKNRWENTFTYRYYPDYFQSYGLGFFEFFQLAEEIEAEPLPVLNVGMACQFQNGDDAHAPATREGLQAFIDDCIDLIDFANGDPATNQWARLRAEMGHPEPFNLKFLGIGNEQWEQPYFDRLAIIAPEVRKAHPEIKIIGTSGPNAEDDHFYNGWKAMNELKADLVDEHFYRSIEWYKEQMNRYDDRKFYTKKGARVFAGEYACHDRGKKWNHAGASLYEAAFMLNIERNADLVHMATYAPLFAHVDGWQWRPDAIWFDNLRSCGSTAYYVQALFAQNCGTNVLPTTLSIDGGKPSVNPVPKGQDGVFASSVLDKQTGEIIVKVVNTTAEAQPVTINLQGTKTLATTAQIITLDLSDYDADNTPAVPERIVPKSSTTNVNASSINVSVPAKTFQIFKCKQ